MSFRSGNKGKVQVHVTVMPSNPYEAYVSFDTETAGFGKGASILELGLVYFQGGREVDRWSTFLDPPALDWNHPNVLSALAVNGIRRHDCAGAPTFPEVAQTLRSFLGDASWCAHNLAFDLQMLNQEFARANLPLLTPPGVRVCTMCTSRKLHPQAPSHALGEVAARGGIVPDGAHRAVVDARAAGEILAKMLAGGHLPTDGNAAADFQKEAGAEWNRRPRRR